jgi:cation diffusion facilitator family transporter
LSNLDSSMQQAVVKPVTAVSDAAKALAPRAAQTVRSASLAAVVNLGLSILQVTAGVLTSSQGLIADGFHSLADVVGDVVVMSTARASEAPPDVEHPYGHHRFENAAAVLLSALLIGAGVGVIWHSLSLLQTGYGLYPVKSSALVAAVVALVVKETLFRYLLRVSRRLGSSVLEADAWHARSDALSSVVVVIGILGNMAGITIFDPLAALVVAAMLLRMGWRFGTKAFDVLTDRATDAATSNSIRRELRETEGVIAVHQLRTRHSGDRLTGDAHIQVGQRVSVSEGHRIAEAAAERVRKQHAMSDFLVHIDAEDDAVAAPPYATPGRAEILKLLESRLPPGFALLDSSPIHFLEGQVEVDALIVASRADLRSHDLAHQLRGLIESTPWLRQVRVFLSVDGNP